MSSAAGISVWRVAGLTYNQYVQVASKALRKCIKPEAQSKLKFDTVMRERVFTQGQAGEKTEIVDMFTKSPFAKSS